MTNGKNGCSFGKVSRNMIENIDSDFKDFRREIRLEFAELKKTNQMLYNHLSDRLPKWAIVIGGLGASLVGILIGLIFNLLI